VNRASGNVEIGPRLRTVAISERRISHESAASTGRKGQFERGSSNHEAWGLRAERPYPWRLAGAPTRERHESADDSPVGVEDIENRLFNCVFDLCSRNRKQQRSEYECARSRPPPTRPTPSRIACETNRVPCISTVAPWQSWFFGRGATPKTVYKWTYHFFWGLEDSRSGVPQIYGRRSRPTSTSEVCGRMTATAKRSRPQATGFPAFH